MDKRLYDEYKVQSALQHEGGMSNLSAYAPQIQDQIQQAQAVLVAQTNPDKVLKDLELQLRGLEEQPDGTFNRINDPLMNDLGIARILFVLRSVVNQNTILSHLEDTEISKVIIGVGDRIAMDLAINWRKYDIKDRTILDYIVDSSLIPAYFALKRALGQNEKNWLGKITVESVSGGQHKPSMKKEGFFNKLRV